MGRMKRVVRAFLLVVVFPFALPVAVIAWANDQSGASLLAWFRSMSRDLSGGTGALR